MPQNMWHHIVKHCQNHLIGKVAVNMMACCRFEHVLRLLVNVWEYNLLCTLFWNSVVGILKLPKMCTCTLICKL